MNIAVMTFTRDRLAYTKHCFQTLRDNAGCDFDWYVCDQASTDGTQDWLLAQDDLNVLTLDENIGLCRGINLLLNEALDAADYDVLVRFDNDCEVVTPDTLRDVADLAFRKEMILAPQVLGLKNPPHSVPLLLEDFTLYETAILGGIFMAIPSSLFWMHGYEYDERFPPWTGDEAIVPWWRSRGGRAGYVRGYEVNHYLGTDGQAQDDPEYFARKNAEMAA